MMKKNKNPSYLRIVEIDSVINEIRDFIKFEYDTHPLSVNWHLSDVRDQCIKHHYWQYLFLNNSRIPFPSTDELKKIVNRKSFLRQYQYILVKNEEAAVKLRLGMPEGISLKVFDLKPKLFK